MTYATIVAYFNYLLACFHNYQYFKLIILLIDKQKKNTNQVSNHFQHLKFDITIIILIFKLLFYVNYQRNNFYQRLKIIFTFKH